MNQTDSFIYGAETVGGAAPTHSTEILSHYMFVTRQDDAEFVVRFALRANDPSSLNTAAQALEANLRMRYQKLTVGWAGYSNPEVFDPAVANSTGFDQEPNLRKLNEDEFPNSGLARGYEFRVSIAQPPNYTDAFGAAAGRRQVDVTEHYDTNDRLVVTMSGEWTQVPTKVARDQFLAQFDGVSGYAAYRLSKINASDPGQGADTWTLVQRDETDPNQLTTLRFTRVYQQHLNGRRGSSVEVFFDKQGLRTVTIRGTYLRTVAGGGGTFGNVYGSANGSLANFQDPTTGGRAFAETAGTGQLALLSTGQGGALTYGSDCELLVEPFVTTNEQDDRTEYTLVYRELNQKQSNAATLLDDPNIIADSMGFRASFSEVNDSTEAPLASAIPGPPGSTASSGGQDSSSLRTVERVSPGQATGGQPSAQQVAVSKPIDLEVSYDAFLKKGLANPEQYYAAQVEPLLISLFQKIFGFSGVEFVRRVPRFDPTTNHVGSDLALRAYSGNVILFQFTLGRFNDTGVRVDPAFTGTPHEYNVQQALPKATMSRKVEAVFRTGPGVAAFSLDAFKSPQAMSGWVKLNDAEPATKSRLLGIPSLGVAQTMLAYSVLEENFIWVARNVAQGGGGGGGSGGSPQATGVPMTVSPPAVAPRVATGVGG